MTLVDFRAAKPLNARVFESDPLGWYVEPEDCTAGLCQVETFKGRTWDPSCGHGNVVKAMRALHLKAWGTDKVDRTSGAEWFLGQHDFLEDRPPFMVENVVCNPPSFREVGTEAFLRQALRVAKSKIALFVSVRFLFGERRARGLFTELPPTKIWFVTPRPSCPPGEYIRGGGKPEGGKGDFVWIVYRKGEPPQPPGWIVRPGK